MVAENPRPIVFVVIFGYRSVVIAKKKQRLPIPSPSKHLATKSMIFGPNPFATWNNKRLIMNNFWGHSVV